MNRFFPITFVLMGRRLFEPRSLFPPRLKLTNSIFRHGFPVDIATVQCIGFALAYGLNAVFPRKGGSPGPTGA